MHDPDRKFILESIQNGFKLITESDPSCVDSYDNDNYTSATCPKFKPEMDDIFLKELDLGRVCPVATKPRYIHSIDRVPKQDSDESRPITDYSRPHGLSVNDPIKPDLESFGMNSIDTAVSFSSRHCYYAIVDIESA